MILIPKLPKNLNINSKRQFLLQQKQLIDSELQETHNLYRNDLQELLNKYRESLNFYEAADNTKSKYIRNAQWFIDAYSSNEKPLTKSDVIKFKEDLQEKYTKISTINSYITTINRFLYFCDLDLFKVTKVKSQSSNIIKDRIYGHELKRMLRKSKELGWLELHFIIRVISECGIRIEERTFFTVKSINNSSLDVEVNNKGKWRTVPIPQELGRDLRAYAKESGIEDGPIFKMKYREIYDGLKRLAALCKIKKAKVKPHAFRHYFGFRFIETNGNAGITQLSDIMGHTSSETTRIYTRGTSQDYRKTMERMK